MYTCMFYYNTDILTCVFILYERAWSNKLIKFAEHFPMYTKYMHTHACIRIDG